MAGVNPAFAEASAGRREWGRRQTMGADDGEDFGCEVSG